MSIVPAAKNLTTEQRKAISLRKTMFEMNLYEIAIVKAMRDVKFGTFEINFVDGVPVRYVLKNSHTTDPLEDVEMAEKVLQNPL